MSPSQLYQIKALGVFKTTGFELKIPRQTSGFRAAELLRSRGADISQAQIPTVGTANIYLHI